MNNLTERDAADESERGLSNGPAHAGLRPVVLMSYPAGTPRGNPYRVILDESLATNGAARVEHFTWRRAFFGRYDVFHAHWPETLIHGRTRGRLLARQLLFALFLVRLGVTRVPIVRTQHNTDLPQGLDRISSALLRAVDRNTAIWIRLNDHTQVPDEARCVTSTHGHYRGWFDQSLEPESVRGRVTFFGLVRRYKGLDRLIERFRELPGDDVSLHVVGKPTSATTAEQLRAVASDDPRVTLRLEMVEDDELVREIGESQLIVLPYTEMHNSAAVITALSLNRPVLVPENDVTTALSEEVGSRWVHTYRGALEAEDLQRALEEVHQGTLTSSPDLSQRDSSPDLSQRDWARVAETHAQAYRRALNGKSSR